ncbi:MAG: hypothetical protein DRH56_04295 [Deltaproteobacteria bacterium]|nr:MAG: hypothetical protein DRH56_04295 [Deltaproteobacteria bacterium]
MVLFSLDRRIGGSPVDGEVKRLLKRVKRRIVNYNLRKEYAEFFLSIFPVNPPQAERGVGNRKRSRSRPSKGRGQRHDSDASGRRFF